MPTADRTAKRLAKQTDRRLYNTGRKIFNAETRRVAQVELGKTVVVTETDGVKSYDFAPTPQVVEPPTQPRLSWLGAKQYKQQGDSRKNRSGFGPEHTEAIPENASRILAKEIDKALMPPVPITDPAHLLTEKSVVETPVIGEYADHENNTLKFEGDRLVEDELGPVA